MDKKHQQQKIKIFGGLPWVDHVSGMESEHVNMSDGKDVGVTIIISYSGFMDYESMLG